jgi:hypothetical protein
VTGLTGHMTVIAFVRAMIVRSAPGMRDLIPMLVWMLVPVASRLRHGSSSRHAHLQVR